jgi:uncharacterized DUF497 family protein
MKNVRFEWDEAKNLSNQRKHDGISFEEARQVFQDPLHVSVQDRIEGGEQRWQTVGAVQGVVILLVAHTVGRRRRRIGRDHPHHFSATGHAAREATL